MQQVESNADISTLEKLRGQVGKETIVTEWVLVSQERIDQFAQATGDFQWIHVDVARAAKESPFGGTIAHGFLTLSLLGKFYDDDIILPFCDVGINYGLNKVRFTAPVPVGSRLRARMKLLTVEPIDNDGVQMSWEVTVEREGSAKPVCVAESLVRRYP